MASITVTGKNKIMNVLRAKEKQVGYGVTANIAASHTDRGSSGFDSPYPNIFLSFDYKQRFK